MKFHSLMVCFLVEDRSAKRRGRACFHSTKTPRLHSRPRCPQPLASCSLLQAALQVLVLPLLALSGECWWDAHGSGQVTEAQKEGMTWPGPVPCTGQNSIRPLLQGQKSQAPCIWKTVWLPWERGKNADWRRSPSEPKRSSGRDIHVSLVASR